jgi:hypothetical protein
MTTRLSVGTSSLKELDPLAGQIPRVDSDAREVAARMR